MRSALRTIGCFALVTAVFISSGFAQPRGGTVVGAKWSYRGNKVVDGKPTGEKIEGGFRVFKFEIFRGPMKVGTVKPGTGESTLTITDWPEMNGTMTVKIVGMRPQKWQGLFKKSDGSEWRMTITVTEK